MNAKLAKQQEEMSAGLREKNELDLWVYQERVRVLVGWLRGIGSRRSLKGYPTLAVYCGCASVMGDFKSIVDGKPSVDKMSHGRGYGFATVRGEEGSSI